MKLKCFLNYYNFVPASVARGTAEIKLLDEGIF